MKTLIYTRGHNTERQIEKCESYAKELGYSIVGTVNDYDDMASLIVSGSIDALLVSEHSRVSRSVEQYLSIKKMLQGYGVKLISAGGEIK